ncbi:creatininase family protein [Anaerotruncus colihominis]|nr:creatininase family protein [Anaerotruncus colihominis]UWN74759.1 creatininase family protein [Anaerotruncus colihominis]
MLKPINQMSWLEVDALDRSRLAYVLPVGSTEQHGRHLPVGTDDLILQTSLDGLEKHLKTENTFLRLPTLHYGNSFEHLDFPGTVTLRTATMLAFVEDLMMCMQRHQVKYLVIVNSHGGNAPVFHAMAQEWGQRFGIRVFNIDYFGSNFFQDAQPLLQTAINQDIHGGEIETAYLQYALPQTVKADFIRPENDVFVELKNYYYGWLTRDLAPGSGLLGGASRSTLETGEKLFRYVQDKLAGYFHAFDKELNDARK